MLRRKPKRLGIKDNQDGSIILIALMLLAVMTMIGIMAADTTVTENFIIRNVGMHKQNVNMAEAAIMETLQKIIQLPPDRLEELEEVNAGTGTGISVMVNSDEAWTEDPSGVSGSMESRWYDPLSGRVLGESANWVVPEAIQNGDITTIDARGEAGDQPLRMAVVGWSKIQGEAAESLKETAQANMRKGKLLAEYISDHNGMVRLEVGIRHKF